MNRVKGFTPVSTVDWPGKVVSVIYIGGCNFRCGYCHNPELALNTADPYPVDDIFRSIEKHQKELPGWIDGIVITGGEPLRWCETQRTRGLRGLCEDLQRFKLPIRIDSNGSSSGVTAGQLLSRGLFQVIMVDIKTTPEKYEEIIGGPFCLQHDIQASIDGLNQIPDSVIDVQFRTTAIPGLVEEPEIREIRKLLRKPHIVQFFRPGRCLDPKSNNISPFTPEQEEAMRKEFNQ